VIALCRDRWPCGAINQNDGASACRIQDVHEAIAGLGQRVKLLCIYGGDGTIYRVINELLRDPASTPPRLALLGGGTMNVAARWYR
jgi:diacylglycerol kinase family enzyme